MRIDLSQLRSAQREHEVFETVRRVWPDWQECRHGKQCAEVLAHWSDDAPFTVTTGRINSTQRFTRTVHLDGTGATDTSCYGVHTRCPDCGQIDTLTVTQEAWLDRTTCTTEGCTYEHVYMIGD